MSWTRASSSVYGANKQVPFSVEHCVSSPGVIDAATKLAGEHIAETYGHLYRIPSTGFRFFTVYGPWGRPDMAAYKFARQIVAGESIAVYNNGDMARDFTYVDDVVAGLMGALHKPPRPNDSDAPHRIYNLGKQPSGAPAGFHCRAGAGPWPPRGSMHFEPMQQGDVQSTFAYISQSQEDFGYDPQTTIEAGIPRFVAWYKSYHNVS